MGKKELSFDIRISKILKKIRPGTFKIQEENGDRPLKWVTSSGFLICTKEIGHL